MKPKQIIIDEEFKGLMPPLAPDEYKLLEESIKTEGCREPIILWHTFLIDGYTRYEICQRNNIEFKTKSIIFRDSFASPAPTGKVSLAHFPNDNRDTVKLWIIKNQLGRRNLTDYDRGRLALQLKPIISEKKKRGRPRKEKETILSPFKTRTEIAKIADLSEGTIQKVEVIEKEASAEVREAVEKGKISINKAYKETKKLKGKVGEPKPIRKKIPPPNINDLADNLASNADEMNVQLRELYPKLNKLEENTYNNLMRALSGLNKIILSATHTFYMEQYQREAEEAKKEEEEINPLLEKDEKDLTEEEKAKIEAWEKGFSAYYSHKQRFEKCVSAWQDLSKKQKEEFIKRYCLSKISERR